MQLKNIALVAGFIATMLVTGCQTAKMTAKSKNERWEPLITTNITLTATGGTTNITYMSPAAGDLRLKETELHGRTQVGTAKAAAQVRTCMHGHPGTYDAWGRWVPPVCCAGGGRGGAAPPNTVIIHGYGNNW